MNRTWTKSFENNLNSEMGSAYGDKGPREMNDPRREGNIKGRKTRIIRQMAKTKIITI